MDLSHLSTADLSTESVKAEAHARASQEAVHEAERIAEEARLYAGMVRKRLEFAHKRDHEVRVRALAPKAS